MSFQSIKLERDGPVHVAVPNRRMRYAPALVKEQIEVDQILWVALGGDRKAASCFYRPVVVEKVRRKNILVRLLYRDNRYNAHPDFLFEPSKEELSEILEHHGKPLPAEERRFETVRQQLRKWRRPEASELWLREPERFYYTNVFNHRSSERERNAQEVYRAERNFIRESAPLRSLSELISFTNFVTSSSYCVNRYGLIHVDVSLNRSKTTSKSNAASKKITISPRAQHMNVGVMIHELAHIYTPRSAESHGRLYLNVYRGLIQFFCSEEELALFDEGMRLEGNLLTPYTEAPFSLETTD